MTFVAWSPACAHNLPYTLLNVAIQAGGRAEVEIRCYVPALIMGAPQGHLGEDLLPTFVALDDAELNRRASGLAVALAAQTTVRIDERLVPTPPIRAPEAAILKTDAQVPTTSPRPSEPLRFSLQAGERARAFDVALPPELGPVVVVVRHSDGATQTFAMRDGERSQVIRFAGQNPWLDSLGALRTYFVEGARHVVPSGLDHMLFIAVMALGAPRPWSLLKLTAAFTIAHSATLALSTLGYVSAPAHLVEPLIALSITGAALMNLRTRGEGNDHLRYPFVLAVGLLHGLGFAGALADLGLPPGRVPEALVGFNLGVEAGQIIVIVGVLAAFGWFRDRQWYAGRIVAPASIALASVGVYLAVERLMSSGGM